MTNDNTPTPLSISEDALLLGAVSLSDYTAALTLGTEWKHPASRNGKPCHYFWKESLPANREFIDARGKAWKFSAGDIDDIVTTMKLAQTRGFEPCAPSSHKVEAASNYGFLVDARKNARGYLEVLHQFIGDDKRDDAMTKKTSICILPSATDEYGNHYTNLIDHNAVLANPRLSDLNDFVPALAASRGQATRAVVLELAAPPTPEVTMDLSKIRPLVGAAANATDQEVLTLAEIKLGDLASAQQRVVALGRDLETSRLDLSRATTPAKPSAEQLFYLGQTFAMKRQAVLKAGHAAAMIDAAAKRYLPNPALDVGTLELSRDVADGDHKLAAGLKHMIDICDIALADLPKKGAPVVGAIELARKAAEDDDNTETPEETQRKKELKERVQARSAGK